MTIIRPTKERLEERMGLFWVTNSPAQRVYTLEAGDVMTSKDVLKLLGCTISLRKGARTPADLAGIRLVTQTDLERHRSAPAAAAMVIESKVMRRWYAVPSVCLPTLRDHEQKNALSRRLYKQMCGLSRFAKVEALFVPQKDSGMGLMDGLTHWVVGVQREWIRNLYQALDHFLSSQDQYTDAGGAAQRSSSRPRGTSQSNPIYGWHCSLQSTM